MKDISHKKVLGQWLAGLIISKHIMGKFPSTFEDYFLWEERHMPFEFDKIRHMKSQMISPIMAWFSILSVCSKVQWTQGVGSLLFFGIRWETMTLHSFSTGRNSLLHHVHAELTNTAKPLENTRWIDATPSFSLEPASFALWLPVTYSHECRPWKIRRKFFLHVSHRFDLFMPFFS